jgi:hypothetical protein
MTDAARRWIVVVVVAALAVACGDAGSGSDDNTPDDDDAGDDDDDAGDDAGDDSGDDDFTDATPLLPGPGQPGYDSGLEALARRIDRGFHAFNAYSTGINQDVWVDPGAAEARAQIQAFLDESDGWDFEAWSGTSPFDLPAQWYKVAGLYAGVGIAADAHRYAVLRDQGYDDAEVAVARDHLAADLEALHLAVAITGTPGVIARGFIRLDVPGPGPATETVPLFDGDGNPLPPEKNNGTWRDDQSGLYPNHIWEDSCSRDQYIGWCAAFGASWEAIRSDDAFPADVKARFQQDAGDVGRALMVVRASGFDLEIPDADGRTTYHGYINENNFDRSYIPWMPFKNGWYSTMALGCVSALAYASEDPVLEDYLYRVLIAERGLPEIARQNQVMTDLGVGTNFSNTNMAFMGAWLALRYVDDPAAQDAVRAALADILYEKPGWPRQVAETRQSLFDFVFAAGTAGASAWRPMVRPTDPWAVARGSLTLREFVPAPHWDYAVENCDETEVETGDCTALDGSHLDVLGPVGWKGDLVAAQPVPMRLRPPSNYYWRSNPYEFNGGGDGGTLLPAVDFRYAYWLGRYVR